MSMATTGLEINVNTDAVSMLIGKVEAMTAYFAAAPDCDPVKKAMADFGEIDIDRDIAVSTEFERGQVVVKVTPSPELKRIMDMVSA